MKLPDFPRDKTSYADRWQGLMTLGRYLDLVDVEHYVRPEMKGFLSGPPAQERELLARHETRIPPVVDVEYSDRKDTYGYTI